MTEKPKKVLNQEAILEETERIFNIVLRKIKVKPASFWNRLKWKILGEGSLLLAIKNDNRVGKELENNLRELDKAIDRGDYDVEVEKND